MKTKFEMRNGRPVLVRLPEINFIDDKDGKSVGVTLPPHRGRLQEGPKRGEQM
jgi:hypothetical protein